MSRMKMFAAGMATVLLVSLTGCDLLDSLPAVFDVEEEGADFDMGGLELPRISFEDIQLPAFSLQDFDLEKFLSGDFKLPEITLEDVLNAYGSKSKELTEEEKDSRYKEYLEELWKEMLEDTEGIEDIELNFEEITGGEKLNVDIDFGELAEDKEAIMEEVTKALEKFFADYEGLTIEVNGE